MSDKSLARIQSNAISTIPSGEEWSTIHAMAKALLPTGFLPQSIKTPEQATAIILKGRELNVPPMQALSSIVVVQGKPTCSAELMLALVQREHGLNAMWVEESTNEKCTVGYQSGNGKKFYSFTLQDAERAGITKNPTWRNYPAAMCRARAISAVARMAFPGAIAGMYTHGELGEPVSVNEDGEVVSVDTGEIQSPSVTGYVRENPQQVHQQPQTTVQVSAVDDPGMSREEAVQELIETAGDNGFGESDVEDYFIFANINPDTVTTKRLLTIADGITKNPTQFGEWLEKKRTERELKNDPSLFPTDEQLGLE